MNIVSIKIKQDKILYKVKNKASSYTRIVNKNRIKSALDKIKNQFINKFLEHPITKEILEGETARNSSGTLGGYGNLFSFIGFEKGSNPIEPILELFNSIDFKINSSEQNVQIEVINFPLADEVWAITPMPWLEGERSWAKGIETGISGLNYYMFFQRELDTEKSLSKHGLQIDSDKYRKKLSNRLESKSTAKKLLRYVPTPYISELLKDFKSRYKKFLSRENKKTLLNLSGII